MSEDHEGRVKRAILALEKDVAVRMVKLQLLGYKFIFRERTAIGNYWVNVYYPQGMAMMATGGQIESLPSIVLRAWNGHVRVNNGWPEEDNRGGN